MNKGKIISIIPIIFRLIIGFVFILAASGKIADIKSLADNIASYRILPIWSVNLFAIILPWIELVCGVLLIFGKYIKASSIILCLLNLIFIIAISSALIRGLDIDCGCFTSSNKHSSVNLLLVVRDVFFVAMCIVIVRYESAR